MSNAKAAAALSTEKLMREYRRLSSILARADDPKAGTMIRASAPQLRLQRTAIAAELAKRDVAFIY